MPIINCKKYRIFDIDLKKTFHELKKELKCNNIQLNIIGISNDCASPCIKYDDNMNNYYDEQTIEEYLISYKKQFRLNLNIDICKINCELI